MWVAKEYIVKDGCGVVVWFVGFFSILIYFYFLSKKMNNYGKIFFVLLLWMISNSIISSFRAGFLFMFLLSIVYHRTKLMDSNSSV